MGAEGASVCPEGFGASVLRRHHLAGGVRAGSLNFPAGTDVHMSSTCVIAWDVDMQPSRFSSAFDHTLLPCFRKSTGGGTGVSGESVFLGLIRTFAGAIVCREFEVMFGHR